ncbi:MAG TPA: efflux RND transporter permease subunit [Candidatus Limnocylindrales bacterium]|nr:efflux RND transporter permease subunit [Candidatus Limnocylindrales bacterium]
MWIVRLALRRPYTFVVGALVLLLLTPFVLLRTPTDIFPSINIPVVSMVWTYAGLEAEDMEQRFNYAQERSLTTTVNDIEHIESTAYNGIGVVKAYFREGTSVDAGVAQVTAIAQTLIRSMPPGTTPPLIIRYSASTVPILQYSISSPQLSEQEIFDISANQIRVGLATVRGAAMPWPYGGKNRIVSVDLDLAALKAKNLAPVDVVNAVNAQNLIFPSGTAKIAATEYAVDLNTSPKLMEDLGNLPIRTVNGAVIHLSDVAQVRDGYQPQQNIVRNEGIRGALLTVYKTGAASTLEVVSGIKKAMPRLLAGLPQELKVKEFSDQSVFVRSAITGVVREGVIAAALTALMILLFLGSWRSTLIIALSIPLSVLASLAILSALQETINLMTLGGLALAVGILVDDATVAIENIHRHMALGKKLDDAILDGAQEIAMPAFVSTLCICIVFVPMFFLTGVAHYLFVPLAQAVVFAMLASYVISRTLVPTLVMWFYRNVYQHGADHPVAPADMRRKQPNYLVQLWRGCFNRLSGIQEAFEYGFERFRESYHILLGALLHHRGSFALFFLVFCGGTMLLVPQLGQDFFPTVDAGQFRLHVRTRTGTRIEETAKLVDEIESVIRKEIPSEEFRGMLDNIGIPASSINLTYSDNGLIGTCDADILVSLQPEHHPTPVYMKRLRARLGREFPGTMFYFLPADIVSQSINFGLPAPFDVQIVGRDQAKNREIAAQLAERIRQLPGAVDVRVQQPGDLPRLDFEVDRTKASEMGLSERDVANSVLLSLSGSGQVQPAYWMNPRNGIQYLINIRVPEHRIDSFSALNSIPINASQPGQGDVQLLANLASLRRSTGPPVISHYNIMPVIDVFGGVSERDLGGVLRDLKPLITQAEEQLPRGSFISLRGQAETMHKSFNGLGLGLLLAMVLIYLLLVVNFQSWLDPFIIITALPGALAGVVWALHLTFTTLSVPALMGAIMSLGVATANSVLVVSFARNALQAGMDPIDAAWVAGVSRLRPVLMTAAAMVIGMLPMALAFGEGGEQNAPLGRAVIGGLVVATVATLFFVPVVFSLLHKQVAVSAPWWNEPNPSGELGSAPSAI